LVEPTTTSTITSRINKNYKFVLSRYFGNLFSIVQDRDEPYGWHNPRSLPQQNVKQDRMLEVEPEFDDAPKEQETDPVHPLSGTKNFDCTGPCLYTDNQGSCRQDLACEKEGKIGASIIRTGICPSCYKTDISGECRLMLSCYFKSRNFRLPIKGGFGRRKGTMKRVKPSFQV